MNILRIIVIILCALFPIHASYQCPKSEWGRCEIFVQPNKFHSFELSPEEHALISLCSAKAHSFCFFKKEEREFQEKLSTDPILQAGKVEFKKRLLREMVLYSKQEHTYSLERLPVDPLIRKIGGTHTEKYLYDFNANKPIDEVSDATDRLDTRDDPISIRQLYANAINKSGICFSIAELASARALTYNARKHLACSSELMHMLLGFEQKREACPYCSYRISLTICNNPLLGTLQGLTDATFLAFPVPFTSDAITLGALTHLNLGKNKIQKLHKSDFEPVPNLKELDLSNNKITTIEDGTFAPLKKLQTLTLDGNRISRIAARTLAELVALRTFSYSTKQKIDPTIEDGAFEDLAALETLKLHESNLGGNLTAATFAGLTTLKRLKLNGHFFFMDDTFTTMTALETLDCSHASNPFGDNEDELLYFLPGGWAGTIPSTVFAQLAALTDLNVSHCGITQIAPDAFEGCPNLETLNLAGNSLHLARDLRVLTPLKKLQSLDILNAIAVNEEGVVPSYNFCENGVLSYLPALATLHAESCNIIRIDPRAFAHNPNLQKAYLSNNPLEKLHRDTFALCPKLKVVYVSSCGLTHLPSRIFSTNVNLRLVHCDSNHLTRRTLQRLILPNQPECRIYNEFQTIRNHHSSRVRNAFKKIGRNISRTARAISSTCSCLRSVVFLCDECTAGCRRSMFEVSSARD